MVGWEAVVPYEGSSPCGGVHALRMCLETWRASEGPWPSAGFLSCLTTLPFGASFEAEAQRPRLVPGPPQITPEAGLDRAVEALGARWRVEHPDGPVQARGLLRRALEEGPVLAGPVNRGALPYHPRPPAGFEEHFVVISRLEGDRIRLQDPAGFPEISLPQGSFFEAWRGDGFGTPRPPFTFRWELRRTQVPTPEEILARVLPQIRENLRAPEGNGHLRTGPAAFRGAAELFRQPVDPETLSYHREVAFPLGARRSSDAAIFLRRFHLSELADLLSEKAALLGEASYAISLGDFGGVVRALERVGVLEEGLTRSFGP